MVATENGIQELQDEVKGLEISQAGQAAAFAGAQTTQAAAQAGTWSTMASGALGLIVGIFLGLSIAGASRGRKG